MENSEGTKLVRSRSDRRAPVSTQQTGPRAAQEATPFIKIEKNLIELGFFTPTRPGLKTTRVKTVTINSTDEKNQVIKTSIRIITGGDYGLPGTGDLDKFLALQKIINGIQKTNGGRVTNPISFTSWELLSVLGLRRKAGSNYKLVAAWLDRMCATTIESVGDGFIAGQRRFGKDRIKVFQRGATFGSEIEKGVIADRNYVWLEKWLLESINTNVVMPIDFETYCTLENSIAKNLVPLLQIWLFTTRASGIFTKNYDDICQLLGITQCTHISKINERLGPSLNELTKHGYLAAWSIEERRGAGGGYKLVFKHGSKFYRDLEENKRRPGQLTGADGDTGGDGAEMRHWVQMLVDRGVSQSGAEKLVSQRAPGQHIGDQIEWIDELIRRRGRENFRNPSGFYIRLIETNSPIDPNFETTSRLFRRRQLEVEAERLKQAKADDDEQGRAAAAVGWQTEVEDAPGAPPSEYDLYRLDCSYKDYVRRTVRRYLQELPRARYAALLDEERESFREKFPEAAKIYSEATATGVATEALEKKYEAIVQVLSFEEFAAGGPKNVKTQRA